jgi:uncharacterized membrane protein
VAKTPQSGGRKVLVLVAGLVLFLGTHTLTTFRGTRAAIIGRVGLGNFKIGYSAIAAVGLVLICIGFSRYRHGGWVQLWFPPFWLHHITFLLMWLAFVSLACMNPAPGRIRGWLRHPMLVAVKFWALAHLLANGDLGGVLLFGAFLAWAVFDRIAMKKRGDLGAPRAPAFTRADVQALGFGTLAYVVMIFLHPYLVGVSVLG